MGGKISAVARLSVVEMRLGPLSDPEASGGPRPGLVAATVLAVALGLVLLLGMMALGGPKRARSRRTMIALVPLPVGLALALLMVWPAYDLLPHSLLISTVSADLPTPGEVPGGPAAVRLANRGRDLVAQAPCGLCHTAYNPYRWESRSAPLSGGTRLRSKAFGRVYAGNLTPDKATGLGAWSAVEVRRAIRAGIGRDGRVFHWEAMPYNHFASYTDVELEAMVTYLRSLSPVDRRVPRPEASDDTDGIAVGLYDYAE
jgi:nicotinate dehydrogenase subunit B